MTVRNKARNIGQIAKGKVKVALGRTTGDEKLKVAGDVDQMKGRVKQVGEKAKDEFRK